MEIYWTAACPLCQHCQPIIRDLNYGRKKLPRATYGFICTACGEKVSRDSDEMTRHVVMLAEAA
jgi:hypothetical protein